MAATNRSALRFNDKVKMSLKYILNGSSTFAPILNAVVGLVGVAITSTCSKARFEIIFDQRAGFERATVVSIVVARANAYVPSMMRRFGSAPNSERVFFDCGDHIVSFKAWPVTHPVVAS